VQFDHVFEIIYPWTVGVDSITLGGAAGVNIPVGPTASRSVAPVAGALRINTDTSLLEHYTGAAWLGHGSVAAGSGITISTVNGISTISSSSSGGSVTSVALSLPSIFNVTGSPITNSGTLTATLNTQAINTVLAGPTIGSSAAPTFRTIGLATNDLNDVTITSASNGQVLSYDGAKWVNSGSIGNSTAGLIGVGQTGTAAWTFSSGVRYYADFAHNLATYNLVVTVFDTSTNSIIIPDSATLTSTNNVRITVIGNTKTLRVVAVANGQAISVGQFTPSSVATAINGVQVLAAATTLNFSGQAVSVTDAGSGTTNIVIGARYSYYANSLDTPNNADFAINALAPVTTDPTYNSLNVRSFSNTIEQGVGFTCSIPPGATQVTFKMKGRPTTAPGSASVVQPRLYFRQIPNGTAMGSWSAANELANIAIPLNAYFQYSQQTVLLSTLGLTADKLYQFELTRRIAGVTGTNLPSAFLLAEITLEFS
jgi:hypothetical protein